jgi:hypothetical protein
VITTKVVKEKKNHKVNPYWITCLLSPSIGNGQGGDNEKEIDEVAFDCIFGQERM